MNKLSLRYLLVGIYNTIIGLAIFYVVNFAISHTVHYLVILTISSFLSIAHAYIGQRWLVFRSTNDWRMEYLRFFSVYLLGIIANALLLMIFVESGMKVMLAQAFSILIVVVFSYFGHRNFSFKQSIGCAEERSALTSSKITLY